jgi:hypothetical protein
MRTSNRTIRAGDGTNPSPVRRRLEKALPPDTLSPRERATFQGAPPGVQPKIWVTISLPLRRVAIFMAAKDRALRIFLRTPRAGFFATLKMSRHSERSWACGPTIEMKITAVVTLAKAGFHASPR